MGVSFKAIADPAQPSLADTRQNLAHQQLVRAIPLGDGVWQVAVSNVTNLDGSTSEER